CVAPGRASCEGADAPPCFPVPDLGCPPSAPPSPLSPPRPPSPWPPSAPPRPLPGGSPRMCSRWRSARWESGSSPGGRFFTGGRPPPPPPPLPPPLLPPPWWVTCPVAPPGPERLPVAPATFAAVRSAFCDVPLWFGPAGLQYLSAAAGAVPFGQTEGSYGG